MTVASALAAAVLSVVACTSPPAGNENRAPGSAATQTQTNRAPDAQPVSVSVPRPPAWFTSATPEADGFLSVSGAADAKTEAAARKAAEANARRTAAGVRRTHVSSQFVENIVEASNERAGVRTRYEQSFQRLQTHTRTSGTVPESPTVKAVVRVVNRTAALPWRAYVQIRVPVWWAFPTRALTRLLDQRDSLAEAVWFERLRALAESAALHGEADVASFAYRLLVDRRGDPEDYFRLARCYEQHVKSVALALKVIAELEARGSLTPEAEARVGRERQRLQRLARGWGSVLRELLDLVGTRLEPRQFEIVPLMSAPRRGTHVELDLVSDRPRRFALFWIDADGLAPWPLNDAEVSGSIRIRSGGVLNQLGETYVLAIAASGAVQANLAPLLKDEYDRGTPATIARFEAFIRDVRQWLAEPNARAALARFTVK